MTRTSFEHFNCSLARTADIVADKWAMLIIRDAFYGIRSFSDFRERLGVAPTVLSDRLQQLCTAEVLERIQPKPGVDRHDYRMTERGRDLFPVVLAMMQWGDKWVFGPGKEPIQILDRETQSPVQPIGVQAQNGHFVTPRDVTFALGPGADAVTTKAFLAMAAQSD